MTAPRATALIADDEPLLRDALIGVLAIVWPRLDIVASARNGREAIRLFEERRPQVCFLDVRMPGPSGIDVARHIGGRSQIVFVTAYDDYAVEAFARGALDYLVKPVEASRVAETAARVQERLRSAEAAPDIRATLQWLASELNKKGQSSPLRWIQAQVGANVQIIAVDAVDFLRSDTKYTLVAWRDDVGVPREALVRTPLKELVRQLDPAQFVQVHRAVVVNLRSVHHVVRGEDAGQIVLKGRKDVLPVSRSFLHAFRRM